MLSKRKLTNEEIEQVLSFIKVNPKMPSAIALSIYEKQRRPFLLPLQQIQIYPSEIASLRDQLCRLYSTSLVPSGKAVGALASTSIGERNTQGSLNSFHFGGQAKVELTTGIPRMEELLNCTRDIRTPSQSIYFDFPIEKLKQLTCVYLHGKRLLEWKCLEDWLVDYSFSRKTLSDMKDNLIYSTYETFFRNDWKSCQWCISLHMNKEQLFLYRRSLMEISYTIESQFSDVVVIPYPDQLGQIDVWVKTDTLPSIEDILTIIKKNIKGRKKELVSHEDWVINEENKESFYVRDLVIPSLLLLPIQGISGIAKVYPEQDKNGQWFLRTKGSSLKQVLSLPDIVSTPVPQWGNLSTTTNHLFDIYECFGIEASYNLFVGEMEKLISVDKRHIDILVEAMTHTGKPQPANRYGIDRKTVGIFAKSAFEMAFDEFLRSSLNGETEDMEGISTCIAAGIPPPVGVGSVITLDEKGKELNPDILLQSSGTLGGKDIKSQNGKFAKQVRFVNANSEVRAKSGDKIKQNVKDKIDKNKASEKSGENIFEMWY